MPSLRKAAHAAPARAPAALASARLRHVALAAAGLLALVVLVLSGLTLWQLRADALAEGQRSLGSLSRTLGAHAQRTIGTVERTLGAAVSLLPEDPAVPIAREPVTRMLGSHVGTLPFLKGMAVYGPAGELEFATSDSDAMPASLAGVELLERHRAHPGGTQLSEGSPGMGTGLFLSLRIDGVAGDFRGVMLARLDRGYFYDFYSALEIAAGTTVSLHTPDGIVVAQFPPDTPEGILPALGGPRALRERGEVIRRTMRSAGSDIHVATYLPRGAAPLLVSVSASERTLLADWRRDVAAVGGSALVIAALIIALALLIAVHLRRRDEMVQRLADSAAGLAEAQRVARLGTWTLERASGRLSCSTDAARLLGAEAETVDRIEALAACAHASDRGRVEQACRAIQQGRSCDVEFRVPLAEGGTRWLRARADAADAGSQGQARCTLMDVSDTKRAEEALQHVAAIVDWTDDAVASYSLDGRILSWNRGAERMFGLPAAEVVGRTTAEGHSEGEARETQRLVELAAGGLSIEGYETVRTGRGSRQIHISATFSPIRDAEGRVVAVSSVARDITLTKRAQARAAVEHAVSREVAQRGPGFDALPQVLRIVAEAMAWSEAVFWVRDGAAPLGLARAAAWPPEAGAGRDPDHAHGALEKAYRSGEAICAPDLAAQSASMREAFGATAGTAAAAAIPVVAGPTPLGVLELRARAPVETDSGWLQTLRTVGSQLGLLLERIRAEQALRESEERFRSLADLSSDWYWEQDAQGAFLEISAGFAQIGVDPAGFIGRRPWEIGVIVPPPGGWDTWRRRMAVRQPFHDLEFGVVAGEGRTRHVSVSGQPVIDDEGNLRGYRGIARDITARRASEARRAVEHKIARLLAGTGPIGATMARVLEEMCAGFEWTCGVEWTVDADPRVLVPARAWGCPDPAGAGPDLTPARIDAEGPLAQVCASAEPGWIADIAEEIRYPNRKRALDAGMRCALLLPVSVGAGVGALLEFLGPRVRLPDPEILAAARGIANQLGQFLERRRAERALLDEKEYIDHVIASAPVLIATISPAGETRSINPAIREIAGYEPAEIEGRDFWNMLDAREGGSRLVRLLAETQRVRVADHPLTIRTRAGERRDLSVSAASRAGPDGEVIDYVLVCTDVSERRADEQRRAAEHAVAGALAEAGSEEDAVSRVLGIVGGILHWDCGIYRVADAGSRTVEVVEDWIGAPIPAIATYVAGLRRLREPPPDGLFRRCLITGTAQFLNHVEQSVHPLQPLAQAAELHAALAVPVPVGDRVTGALQFYARQIMRPSDALLGSMQTIGRQLGHYLDRRRAERARQQADERLRGIAANIPGIVFEYRLAPEGNASFTYVSERATDLLEETPEALESDPALMFRLVDSRYRAKLLRTMHVSRHSRALWFYEMPICTRSGRVRWVRGQSMPKYFDDGSVVWDGVIIDVTAQKQAEQAIQQLNEQLERRVDERTSQLRAANRELESFAYSVSHDLRAPLRSIDGFSRILMEEYGTTLEPAAADYLTRVRRASERMGELIDDLLSLSRVTRSEIKRVRTDLSSLAATIVEDLRAAHPDRIVDASIHPGLASMADPSLMRILLENLIGNAWKFTARLPRASIEFGALQRGGKTVYYVRDNGAGFDMAHAGKLFGAFQRLHSPREFEGTGIGLATVSRIVDRHGGRIWAEAAPGKGATFFFTLSRTRT